MKKGLLHIFRWVAHFGEETLSVNFLANAYIDNSNF